jgi:Helix-turn-helix domain
MSRSSAWVPLPRAATRLGLSPDAVLSLIHSRALPATLVGGARWFVQLKDIEAFKARRRAPNGPGQAA